MEFTYIVQGCLCILSISEACITLINQNAWINLYYQIKIISYINLIKRNISLMVISILSAHLIWTSINMYFQVLWTGGWGGVRWEWGGWGCSGWVGRGGGGGEEWWCIWPGTNTRLLLIGLLGINVSGILIEINTFSFKKRYLKMSSAKWRLFRLGLNELSS